MIKCNNNTIQIIRGDSGGLVFDFVNPDNSKYTLQNTDKAVFSVKSDYDDTVYVIQKTLSQDGKITFLPSDTTNLSVGSYVYDVQLTKADGQVDTVLLGKLKIIADVTR